MLVRNRARAQTIQRILLAEDIANFRFQDWLKEQNNAGADVFLGMNPLRANSFARTKESVREIRHVYLDLDEDAPASLRAIRTDGNTAFPPLFSIPRLKRTKWSGAWTASTGNRPNLYCVLSRINFKQTSLPLILRVFCACLDLPTISTTRHLSCAQSNSQMRFTTRAISRFTKTRPRRRAVSDGHSPPCRLPSGHRSQSEADWAYAKRALARGDNARSKSSSGSPTTGPTTNRDLLYYARHTVEKAQADSHRDWQRDASQTSQDFNQRTEFRPHEAITEKAEDQGIDRK